LVGRMADLHFAPTPQSQAALLAEGTDPETVFVTGNTVIDALIWVRDKVAQDIPSEAQPIAKLLGDEQVVLVTGHRRESFGGGFENMCQAIRDVADAQPDWNFVYPVHLNPNVQKPVNRLLADHPRIHLIQRGGAFAGQAGSGHARNHRARRRDRGWQRKAGRDFERKNHRRTDHASHRPVCP